MIKSVKGGLRGTGWKLILASILPLVLVVALRSFSNARRETIADKARTYYADYAPSTIHYLDSKTLLILGGSSSQVLNLARRDHPPSDWLNTGSFDDPHLSGDGSSFWVFEPRDGIRGPHDPDYTALIHTGAVHYDPLRFNIPLKLQKQWTLKIPYLWGALNKGIYFPTSAHVLLINESYEQHNAPPSPGTAGRNMDMKATYRVSLWDVRTQKRLKMLPSHHIPLLCYAISSDERSIALCFGDASIQLYDTSNGTLKTTLPEEVGAIKQLRFSPDGRFLAAGGGNGAVRVWNVQRGQPATSFQSVPKGVSALCFSPDNTLLAAGHENGGLSVWNLARRQVLLHDNNHNEALISLAFAPDSLSLATGDKQHYIRLWSLK